MILLFKEQDTPGPMTRSVKDAAFLLDIFAEYDGSQFGKTYLEACSSVDISGLRIGVPTTTFQTNEVVLDRFEEVLQLLERAGAIVIRDITYDGAMDFEALTRAERFHVVAGGFQRELEYYLASLKTNPHSLHDIDDIIRLTKQTPEEDYPARGIEDFELVSKVDIYGPEYKKAFDKNQYFAGEGGIFGALKRYNPDLIAAPDDFELTNSFAARPGFPVIALPSGSYPEGTPVKYFENGPTQLVAVGPNVP
jgi:amidase